MRKLTLLFVIILIGINAFGQVRIKNIKMNEFPGRGTLRAPSFKTPKINRGKLLEEDLLDEQKGLPPRFGKAFDSNLSLKDGVWEILRNGRVWKLEIQSSEALSINLIFNQFYLPEGAEMYLYNRDRSSLIGPVNKDQNNENKIYSTPLIPGNTMIIELFEPKRSMGKSELQVGKIVHGYKNISGFAGFGESANCNIDIECSQGGNWQDESNAVAMIIVNGNRWCSGALVANDCRDFTPSFLTAFHCLDDGDGQLSQDEQNSVQSWVFWFNYRSSTCNGGDGNAYYSFSGATLRSASRDTDFALLELNHRPQPFTNIKYAGWNSAAAVPTSSVGIHHPKGDVMKISIEDDPATLSNWYAGTTNTHLEVEFDEGTVEGGSSGSPLFDPNGRIVGQLHGGISFDIWGNPVDRCVYTDALYGRLNQSWEGGGTLTTQLRPWLTNDPTVTQANILMSIPSVTGPNLICTSNLDFTISNVPAGQTASWSVSPSNLVYTATGTGTTASLKAKTLSSMGSATITFTLSQGTNCPNSATFTKTFWVGKPSYNNLILWVDNNELSNCDYTYAEADYSGQTMGISEYEWDIPYSSDWYIDEEYGSPADWQYVEIDYFDEYPPNQEAIHLRARNACNWSLWEEYWVDVDDCAGGYYAFTFSPNPAEEVLTVTFNSEEENTSSVSPESADSEITQDTGIPVEVAIYNNDQTIILYEKGNTENNMELDISSILPGSYFIHVSIEGDKTYKKHLIIE